LFDSFGLDRRVQQQLVEFTGQQQGEASRRRRLDYVLSCAVSVCITLEIIVDAFWFTRFLENIRIKIAAG
jgi:hypothetical protein